MIESISESSRPLCFLGSQARTATSLKFDGRSAWLRHSANDTSGIFGIFGNPHECACDHSPSGSWVSAPTRSPWTPTHTCRAFCPEPVSGDSLRCGRGYRLRLIVSPTLTAEQLHVRGATAGQVITSGVARARGSTGEAPYRLDRGSLAGPRAGRTAWARPQPGLVELHGLVSARVGTWGGGNLQGTCQPLERGVVALEQSTLCW